MNESPVADMVKVQKQDLQRKQTCSSTKAVALCLLNELASGTTREKSDSRDDRKVSVEDRIDEEPESLKQFKFGQHITE